MCRMRPARRNRSATSQQPPARNILVHARGRVEPVEREQVQRLHPQQRERFLQLRLELRGPVGRARLGLQHERVARVARQRRPELRFAGAVAARGLDVVDAHRQRPGHDRVEVRWLRADRLAALPALLGAHAAT